MKKIAIISCGGLPIPPVKGGAVENLIQFWVENNECQQLAKLTVFSAWDDKAYAESKKYKNTEFVYAGKHKLANAITKQTNRVFRKLRFGAAFQISPFLIDVVKKIKKNDFDCIIVENVADFVPYLRKKTQIPILLHMHNDYLNSTYFLAKEVVTSSTQVLTVSEYVKQCVLTIEPEAKNVGVLRNVINVDAFKNTPADIRETWRKTHHIADSDIVFAFFGRITPGKGIRELIQAFCKLAQRHNNVMLLIVGAKWFGESQKSKFMSELEQMAAPHMDKVIFTGYVDYHDIPSLYACADVVVAPSIMGEAAPLVVLEAMASGRALIVSDSGGIPEYATPNCAIQVARGAHFVEELEKAMNTLVSDQGMIESMEKHGQDCIQNYDCKTYLAELLDSIKI